MMFFKPIRRGGKDVEEAVPRRLDAGVGHGPHDGKRIRHRLGGPGLLAIYCEITMQEDCCFRSCNPRLSGPPGVAKGGESGEER